MPDKGARMHTHPYLHAVEAAYRTEALRRPVSVRTGHRIVRRPAGRRPE